LELKGFKINFEDGIRKICYRNTIMTIVYKKRKLYELNLLSINTMDKRTLSDEIIQKTVDNTELWHKHLIHLSYNKIQKLEKLDGIQVEKVNINFVKFVWRESKSNYFKRTKKTLTRLLQLFTMMSWTKNLKSYNNMQYVISFIDFTHFITLHMESKEKDSKYFKM